MKITAAFKVKELYQLFGVGALVAILVMGLVPSFLFQTALLIWVPFFLLFLLIIFQYPKNTFPAVAICRNRFFLMIKMLLFFILIVFCYFGFGQGLLLYQVASYNEVKAPVLTQFPNDVQLLWAVKLAAVTWMIACGLALLMAMMDKHKISQFFTPLVTQPSRYALVIDTLIMSPVLLFLLFYMGIASFEISRSAVAYFGIDRPIFPELTAIIFTLVLVIGYQGFFLKKRANRLAKKNVSMGRIGLTQMLWVTVLLLLGQAIIIFFPQAMTASLMQPIKNIFTLLDYKTAWLFVTLTLAIISSPLLARFLVRTLAGLSFWLAFLMLIIPLGLGLMLMFKFGLTWVPQAFLMPIGLDNIIYRIGFAQIFSIGALLLLLLCFMRSKSLQMAFVDIMPSFMGQRLRRLRALMVKLTLPFFLLTLMYLFLTYYSYYFLGAIFLVLVTLTLLWVSLHSFYTLTYKTFKINR